jgi:Phage gp6-like head-tail connector protein
MPYPLIGLSYTDVGQHLQFTRDELNGQQEDGNLLIAITKAAIAHVETLCGTLTDPVPDELIAAVKMLCGHLYENRELGIYGTGTFSNLPSGFDELILNHRVWAF